MPPRVTLQRMALLSIRLRHVDWRNGKPMFKPSGKLYALGFKAQALRHYFPDGSAGAWFTLEECRTFVEMKEREIEAARKNRPLLSSSGLTRGSSRKKFLYAVEDLFRDFLASPAARELAASTLRDYRGKSSVLEKFDPVLVRCAAAALDQPIVYDLYQRLRQTKGLSQSRGIIAVLSAALSWGMLTGKVRFATGTNPAQKLRMKTPKPRLRVGEISEMRTLVAAADAIGRPDVGDAIMLGLWTGQRQGDRLALVDEGLVNSRRIFRQSKTGAVVAIHEAPELEARLTTARERRKDWVVVYQWPRVIMDETARSEFRSDWYRHVFSEVRSAAVEGIVDEEATAAARAIHSAERRNTAPPTVWKLAPCPSLKNFHDQDLRDTAVTWMALASATIPEIIAVTGHTLTEANNILRHYLGRHPELADAAIAKMVTWYEGASG